MKILKKSFATALVLALFILFASSHVYASGTGFLQEYQEETSYDNIEEEEVDEPKSLRITALASISPTSASILSPTYITLASVPFASTVTKVELIRTGEAIELPLLRYIASSASLKCLHKGGKIGAYKPRITLSTGKTIAMELTITFATTIESVSPSSGNYQGGVILTITGTNFSPIDSENPVFIGDLPCPVLSATETKIKCLTPAVSSDAVNTSQYVTIRSNGLSSTFIQGQQDNTKYTFIQTDQPTITSIGSNTVSFIMGETVIINGTNLILSNEDTVLFIGSSQLDYTVSDSNSDQISFVVPYDISTTTYNLTISVGHLGTTAPVPFPILTKINNIRCLNPDGQLSAIDGVIPFFAVQITGKLRGSTITLGFNQLLDYAASSSITSIGYTDVFINDLNIQGDNHVTLANTLNTISVDGTNVLNNPITILHKASNPSITLTYSLDTDSDDFTYFVVVFEKLESYLDLVVYDVFLKTENDYETVYFMDKVDDVTFRFKKFSKKTFIQISACSNYGSVRFTNVFDSSTILTTPSITKVTTTKVFIAGDLIKFKIPGGNGDLQQYFMAVLCRYRAETDEDTSSDDHLLDISKGKDVFVSFPFAVASDVYSFYFPVILKRATQYQSQCDVSIQFAKGNNILYVTDLHTTALQATGFLTDFTSGAIGDFANYFIQYSNSLKLFSSCVIPEKKNIIVTSISPSTISCYGGQTVTLTGTNLISGTQKVVVKLQGVPCTVITQSATQITCLSGEKDYYNILDLQSTTLTIGNINAVILTEIIYVFNYNDPVKFTYFENELGTAGNLYVPQQYGLILNIADIFPNNNSNTPIVLNNIAVDGLLILSSSLDQTIQIASVSGNGAIRFGTNETRITNQVSFVINEFSIKDVSAYGGNDFTSNFQLATAISAQSSIATVSSSAASISANTPFRIVSLSLDDSDLDITSTSSTSTTISFNESTASSFVNINESLSLTDGSTQSFQVQHQIVQTSRNLVISIKSLKYALTWSDLISAKLILLDTPNTSSIDTLKNAVLEISATTNIQIDLRVVTSSVLLLKNRLYWEIFSESVVTSYILASYSSTEVYWSNRNDALSFTSNYISKCSLIFHPRTSITFSQNTIVKADICVQFGVDYTYTYPINGASNLCVSVNSVGTSLPFRFLTITQGFFLRVVDVRHSIVRSSWQHSQIRNQDSVNDARTSIFYAIFANLARNNNTNTPCVVHFSGNSNGYYKPQILSNIAAVGFSSTYAVVKDYTDINVLDARYLITDVSTTSYVYNATSTYGFVLIDRNGNFTGSSQTILSSDIVRPSYLCTLNSIQYNVCAAPLSLIRILLNEYIPPWIDIELPTDIRVIVDENYESTIRNVFLFVQNSTTTMNVVQATNTTNTLVPYTVYLNLEHKHTESLSTIVSYAFNTNQYKVENFFANKYTGHTSIKQSSTAFTSKSCSHGQYYATSSGVNVCMKSLDSPVLLVLTPLDVYPLVVPQFNDFFDQVDIQYSESGALYFKASTISAAKRVVILRNSNVILSDSGIYEIPSLEIKGTLTIDLGSKSATIRTKGICISGGQILYLSGKITFEFITDDSSNEVIFRYFYNNINLKAGSFAINSNFKIINENSTPLDWTNFRITAINSSNNKIVTVNIPSASYNDAQLPQNVLQVGDSLLITAPTTSLTLQTTIVSIVTAYNSNTNTVVIELADSYGFSSEFLTTNHLDSTQDFRPIVAKLNRNITIKNANIQIFSYINEVFSEVDFSGVAFVNSTVQLSKWFSRLKVSHASFSNNGTSSSTVPVLRVSNPVLSLPNQSIQLESQVIIENTIFAAAATSHINIERFSNEYLGYYMELGYKIFTTYYSTALTDSEAFLIADKFTISNNLFVNAGTTSIVLDSVANLANNRVIKAQNSCVQSTLLCQAFNADQLFDCGASGFETTCDTISNLLVARTTTFASAPYGNYTNVISIENTHHFNLQVLTLQSNYFFNYALFVHNSVISFNSFSKSALCAAQSAVRAETTTSSNKFIAHNVVFSATKFTDFNCEGNAIIETANNNIDLFPIFSLIDSTCENCSIEMKNIVKQSSSATSLPSSFRGQDNTGRFINPSATNAPLQYKVDSLPPYFKIASESYVFSYLALKQYNNIGVTPKSNYTLNSTSSQTISTRANSALAFVQSQHTYTVTADKPLNYIKVAYSSPVISENQYVILSLTMREGYELMIKDNSADIVLPTPLDLTSPSTDLLSIMGGDISSLECGMNIQDSTTRANYVVLTSNSTCQLTFIESLSIKLKFKIATPILDPPTPEEEGKCDADRRVIYLILRIATLLKIEVSRVRVLGRTESICTTGSTRLLDASVPDTIEYIVAIDPIATEEPTDAEQDCTSAECEQLQIQKQNTITNSVISNLQNVDNLFGAQSVSLGLQINKMTVTPPMLVSDNGCSSGQLSQDSVCVAACSNDYYQYGNMCVKCSSGCNGCNGSTKYDCNTCHSEYTTMTDSSGDQYCGKCPTECSSCTNETTCTSCSVGYVLSNSICVVVCPSGTYNADGFCSTCPSGCSACLSATECTSCVSGDLQSNKRCSASSSIQQMIMESTNDSSAKIVKALIASILMLVFALY